MKIFKKALSAVTAGAVTLSLAAAGSTAMLSTVNAADMTAIELVDDMGNGWNLGNTFDCWGNITWTDQTWTAWGNKDEYLTQALFTSIKNSGFDSVRIPITWSGWTDSSTYDIDDSYLAKIKTMVDYCYANDMYVIINMHWDWVSDGSQWLNAGSGAKTQFLTMWKEIANYFKDYDNHLVFEDMNEVTFDYSTLNDFNASFVDTVRATGGNNADRLLLLAGSNTNQEATCNSQFVVPDDDMVAVSIHYYTPPQWCVAEPGASWGYSSTWDIDTEAKAVYDDFNEMANYFVTKGVPVIIGEYGVLNYYNNAKLTDKSASDIADYLRTVASAGLQTEGIATFLWDDSTGQHQCFDRATLSWYDKEVQQVYSDLASGDVEVPEGLLLTDRVTYTVDKMEDLGGNCYNIDLTPYKDLNVTITDVVIEGSITSASNSAQFSGGGVVAFNGFLDGGDATTRSYCTEEWYFDASNFSCITNMDGTCTIEADDGTKSDHEYEMEFDFMNINTWWTWSATSGDTVDIKIDQVTLIFDQKIYVDAETGVVVPDEEDPTDEPTDAPTDEPTDAPTDEPTEGPVTEAVYGDVDDNGKVEILDVIALSKSLMGSGTLSTQGAANADVDQNGAINTTDALNIMKYLVKLIEILPV